MPLTLSQPLTWSLSAGRGSSSWVSGCARASRSGAVSTCDTTVRLSGGAARVRLARLACPVRRCQGRRARGWKRGIRLGVRRALIIVLSGHAAGDTVCYSEVFPALRARDISVERAAEVLQEMGVLVDDRRPSFEGWLERKLDGLADGIGREAGSWLRTMRDGGPRSRARSLETVWCHMKQCPPRAAGLVTALRPPA